MAKSQWGVKHATWKHQRESHTRFEIFNDLELIWLETDLYIDLAAYAFSQLCIVAVKNIYVSKNQQAEISQDINVNGLLHQIQELLFSKDIQYWLATYIQQQRVHDKQQNKTI